MIPSILVYIAQYLKQYELKLVTGGDDRVNSGQSENIVIAALQNTLDNKWKVISPNVKNNRYWYDFICVDNKTQKEYYCNIKVSNCNTYDNMNAKKAIYWLLTGDQNVEKISNNNKQFFKLMKENENLENRDYYYLIVNKQNIKDIYFVSLKNINSKAIRGSHNNPPFQAHWDKCRNFEYRTMHQAKDYFLQEWAKVIDKHIQNLNEGMPSYYPEYFN